MVDAKSRRAAIDARARTRYRRLMRKGDRRQDHEQDAKRQAAETTNFFIGSCSSQSNLFKGRITIALRECRTRHDNLTGPCCGSTTILLKPAGYVYGNSAARSVDSTPVTDAQNADARSLRS
jgi:hypothetical protein